jgi:hypothetical protein
MGKMVDKERLARLVAALDARMKEAVQAEEERARLAEGELQEALDEIEDMVGGRTIVYLTQIEFDALTDDEKNDESKAYFITDAEEYNIWVGTAEELEAITERDINTIYFELEDEDTDSGNVVPIEITNGVLQLTTDKYQKVNNMITGTQIQFPAVPADRMTEIHLFFTANEDMNLVFPENCKWRVDPNIQTGKAYEIVCKFNTMFWLVNIMVFS